MRLLVALLDSNFRLTVITPLDAYSMPDTINPDYLTRLARGCWNRDICFCFWQIRREYPCCNATSPPLQLLPAALFAYTPFSLALLHFDNHA
jgi:hypothetical protein